MIHRLTVNMKRMLPKEEKVIVDVRVLSIADWNNDDVYGKYPISRVDCSDT